jgi:apolipoprotein N-acyltransferase
MFFAALLFATSFEPLGFWLAAPIAYALFLRRISSRAYSAASYSAALYRDVFIFAFLSSLITLVWAGKYVGFIPLAFLALLHGLFYLPLALLRRYTSNVLLFIPAILVIEEIRARFPFAGFSWMRIAFSQADAPYLAIVSVGGVTLLSAWVLFISLIFTKIRVKRIALALILILSPLLLSHSPDPVGILSYAGVQGNTPTVGLGFNDRAKAVFNLHVRTTKEMITTKPDLIIWPENAIDVDPFTNLDVQQSIESITSTFAAPLIAGAVTRTSGKLENVSVMYNVNGEVASLYSKQYLTPFGEYIPLRSIARLVSPFVDNVSDFSQGERTDVHRVETIDIAPVICYELLSDSLVRNAAARSQAFVVQTNSATFAGTSESAQQLNITRIRAVENAREIVSISTIGISAHIDINGHVTQQTPENVQAILEGQLQGVKNQSIASRLGSTATPLALVISFSPFALRRIRPS